MIHPFPFYLVQLNSIPLYSILPFLLRRNHSARGSVVDNGRPIFFWMKTEMMITLLCKFPCSRTSYDTLFICILCQKRPLLPAF